MGIAVVVLIIVLIVMWSPNVYRKINKKDGE